MTLPYERTRAVLYTEQFLRDLMDPKKTPGIPKQIRRQAASCLRHYPTKFEMEVITDREDKCASGTLGLKIFGSIDYLFERKKDERSI